MESFCEGKTSLNRSILTPGKSSQKKIDTYFNMYEREVISFHFHDKHVFISL